MMDSALNQRLEYELGRFQKLAGKRRTIGDIEILPLDDWTVELRPKAARVELPEGKTIGLTILALVHGNEVGGAASLNDVAEFILTSCNYIPYSVVLGLGNPWAAREGVRFLERDLNRSFGSAQSGTLEERRARELEPHLARSAYLLDVHQTTEHADRPFFIFPYEPHGFGFASLVAPHVSIVTHWGDPFSSEGQCTDEYVNAKGGTGITLELGQSGFDTYQVGFGVQTMLAAVRQVQGICERKTPPSVNSRDTHPGQIFTWAGVVPYPKGDTDLVPGWYNFKKVEKGQVLGHCDGAEIVAPASGHILFPKYRKPSDVKRPPTELCRIMKEISLNDLPGV